MSNNLPCVYRGVGDSCNHPNRSGWACIKKGYPNDLCHLNPEEEQAKWTIRHNDKVVQQGIKPPPKPKSKRQKVAPPPPPPAVEWKTHHDDRVRPAPPPPPPPSN